MEHNRRDADTFTGKIVKVWPMMVALISVIVMATTLKNKVDSNEARIASSEARITRLENSMLTIESSTDRLVYELLDKKKR